VLIYCVTVLRNTLRISIARRSKTAFRISLRSLRNKRFGECREGGWRDGSSERSCVAAAWHFAFSDIGLEEI
jgi:hypothetical protein